MSTAISQGAKNDTPESLLRKHLSPALKGRGWDSLIAAIATGDSYVRDTATSAFNQLFKSTASGIYLDRIAANDGFSRPSEIGMSDDTFRKLAIKTTARKQIAQVILETLEAYYGSDATRAFIISSVEEPFLLESGDQLLIKIDNDPIVTVTFQTDDFQQISSAKAVEVVARINRAFQLNNSTGYAVSFRDPSQNKTFIKIFSGSLGLSGGVSIHGGRSQNIFKFPTLVHPSPSDGPQIGTQFSVLGGTGINGVSSGRVRFTYTGGPDPDLISVQVGDYATVFGSIFPSDLRNTYRVVNVSTTTVELENNDLTWPASVTIVSLNDLKFFRATISTIQSTGRMATVVQGDPTTLEILLPATTQAVNRTKNTAAYLHVANSISVSSGSRDTNGIVTINTSSSHGMSINDLAFIDNLVPNNSVAYTTAWVNADPGSIISGFSDGRAVLLPNGNILFAGGYDGSASLKSFIYNSTTSTWSAAADMNVARHKFQMALLQNGKVLVQGGVGLSSAELYDYVSNTWTLTGSAPSNRSEAVCLTLKDGRVMVVSGDGTGSVIAYDPVTGLWSALANITSGGVPTSFDKAAGALLPDGRVVVGGGNGSLRPAIYNPIVNSWRESDTTFSAGSNLEYLSAIFVPIGQSGKVLFSGGGAGANYEIKNYLFDPSTQRLTQITSLSLGRRSHGVSLMRTGSVIIIGGEISNAPTATNTTEILDVLALTWSAGPTLLSARSFFPVVKLLDNKIMAVGGVNPTGPTYLDPEIYTDFNAVLAAGGLNGLSQVLSTPSGTSFTFSTPDFKFSTTLVINTGTVTPIKTPADTVPGPFIFDLSGPAITSVETQLTQQLVSGNNYTVISVSNSSLFPDAEGYLVFGFGTNVSTFPVKYLSRISGTSLLLDPSFVFPITLPSGTKVTLLNGRGSFTPENPEEVGSFYLTASSSGRVAASKTIDDLVAFGINVKKTIIYPGDRGLGNEGFPVSDNNKLSDKVIVWGSDSLDEEIAEARN